MRQGSLELPGLLRHRKQRRLRCDADASASGIDFVWRARRIDRHARQGACGDEPGPGVLFARVRWRPAVYHLELIDLIESPQLQERTFGAAPEPGFLGFGDLLPEEARRRRRSWRAPRAESRSGCRLS